VASSKWLKGDERKRTFGIKTERIQSPKKIKNKDTEWLEGDEDEHSLAK
jgi:hypothetical protein